MGQLCGACFEAQLLFVGVEEVHDEDLVHTVSPQVSLHVYDVSNTDFIRRANKVFRKLGTGAFHAGVEIYGVEYSFGWTENGTGIFGMPAASCPAHHYREALVMGDTLKDMHEVADILQDLAMRWQGYEYNLLRHNCTHFCRDFLDELEVKPIPRWVVNLAGAGATISDGVGKAKDVKSKVTAMNIIEAAKAGRIHTKYQVKAKFERVKTKARNCGDYCLDARRPDLQEESYIIDDASQWEEQQQFAQQSPMMPTAQLPMTQLTSPTAPHQPRVIMITGALPGDGSSAGLGHAEYAWMQHPPAAAAPPQFEQTGW